MSNQENEHNNENYYDDISKFYDTKHNLKDEDMLFFIHRLNTIAPQLTLEGALVLDVGSGSGRGTLRFAELGSNVTALDVSPKILEICKSKAKERGFIIDSMVGSINQINLPAEHFDIVTFSAALHHIENLELAIQKSYLALKPGGYLILLAEPKRSLIRPRILRERKERLSAIYDSYHRINPDLQGNPDIHIFDVNTLSDQLKTSGFTITGTYSFRVLASLYRDLLYFKFLNKKTLRNHLMRIFERADQVIFPHQQLRRVHSLFDIAAKK